MEPKNNLAFYSKNLASALKDYIGKYKHVRFIELHQNLGKKFDLKGTCCFGDLDNNTIIWAGMSDEFLGTIGYLWKKSREIYFTPCNVLVYFCDGGGLNLPIAKQSRAYKKDHWMPVSMNLGNQDDHLGNRKRN